MKRFSQKQTLLLFYCFDIVLIFILVLLFLPFSRKNVPESMSLKFVDEPDSVTAIEIYRPSAFERIFMENKDGFWIGTDDESNRSLNWPCDVQTMKNFLNEAGKMHNLSKKAEKVSSWKNLGVDEKNSCRITFFDENGIKLSAYWFGIQDAVTGKISFRTSKNQTVWETETSISNFIFGDTSFWADPYLEPVCLTDNLQDSEKGLRRGRLAYISPSENIKPVKVISKRFDNGKKAVYSIYEKDDSYIVIPSFSSIENSDVLKSINYRYSISRWTYNKFLEASDE